MGSDRSDIREPDAFLSRTVTRLCLDHLKSARVQRERYLLASMIALATFGSSAAVGVSARTTWSPSCSTAMLAVALDPRHGVLRTAAVATRERNRVDQRFAVGSQNEAPRPGDRGAWRRARAAR